MNGKVLYTGHNNATYIIRLNDERCYKGCSCTCSGFIKWAICHHLVAYSISIGKDYYGIKYRLLEKFHRNTKKGAKPKGSGAYVVPIGEEMI